MKYIEADLLRKEIEKRLKNIRDYMSGTGIRYKGPKYFKAQGKESAYDALLNIIDSLQQEQPEVDLEKAARKYTKKNTCYNPDPDLLRISTKEAFIAGAEWKEKQMMEEAVEGEVVKDIRNKLAVTAKINLDEFKFGDKVKVSVIK